MHGTVNIKFKTGSWGILYWGRLLQSVKRSQVCLKSWIYICGTLRGYVSKCMFFFLWNCLRLWKTLHDQRILPHRLGLSSGWRWSRQHQNVQGSCGYIE